MSITSKRLIAMLLGVLFFFLSAELVSRAVFQLVVCFHVEMWRYAREVKTVGVTPGLLFEHRPNVKSRLMGVDVDINADGLRDRDFGYQKAENTVRIAVVGDSVTFGWGVAQEEVYSRQLETELNRRQPFSGDVTFEVLNFGVGNYGITDVAAMMEHKVIAYRPDLIIYGAFINDAEMPDQVGGGVGLLQHSVFAVWVWGRLDALWRRLGWREDYRDYYLGLYREGQPGPALVMSTLSKMKSLSGEQSIPLVVLLFPELHDDSGATFAPIRDFYKKTSATIGIEYLDLQDALPVGGLRRYWVAGDDSHPNAAAFSLFARHAAEALPWQNLLHGRSANQHRGEL